MKVIDLFSGIGGFSLGGEKDRGKKLKGLGNAVVPPQIAKIGALIMEYEEF